MTVSLIVAIDNNYAIGRRGALIYRIPADLRRFREITMGHPIIMGRCTFESLPKGALPGRTNIVVTHNNSYAAPGACVVNSLADAITLAREIDPDEAFIIGGAQLYREALDNGLVDKLLLTEIDSTVDDADTFLPLDRYRMTLISRSEPTTTDDGITYRFADYSLSHN